MPLISCCCVLFRVRLTHLSFSEYFSPPASWIGGCWHMHAEGPALLLWFCLVRSVCWSHFTHSLLPELGDFALSCPWPCSGWWECHVPHSHCRAAAFAVITLQGWRQTWPRGGKSERPGEWAGALLNSEHKIVSAPCHGGKRASQGAILP